MSLDVKKIKENLEGNTCTICYEDEPNRFTVCCGQAVHSKCIIEWRGVNSRISKGSCHYCRSSSKKQLNMLLAREFKWLNGRK